MEEYYKKEKRSKKFYVVANELERTVENTDGLTLYLTEGKMSKRSEDFMGRIRIKNRGGRVTRKSFLGGVLGANEAKLANSGRDIYNHFLKEKLESVYRGKIIAIEPESKGYIIGNSVPGTARSARRKYPGKTFHFMRIGYPTLHVRK